MNKSYCRLIGVSPDHLADIICEMNVNGLIPQDYIHPIAEAITEAVAQDIYESADPSEWNDDDVRLAIGRVLCKRLGIEV